MSEPLTGFRFDIRSAIQELITRHHFLAADVSFAEPLQKWGAQERRLLLDVAAKWLLHPNVTVDAAVAFRPVIGELLHRLFSQPSRPTTTANPFPRIVCALSRILPITPQVQEEALTYLRGSLSVFEAVQHEFKLVGASHSDADSSMVSLCLEVVQAAYRFLRFSVASFRELWDWSPLFHLVSFSHQPDIASFAAQSLVLLLGMSDAETQGSLLFQHLLTNSSCIAVFDDREARNKSLRFATATPDQQFEGAFVTAADLSSAVVDVCGFLLPVKSSVSKAASALHYTSTTRANMQSLALAVCRGNPILLAGPTGAGKTYLIQQLANQTNNRDLIKIHLGDQSDAKVLLGSYVVTDIPGQFRWVPGALTTAVAEGRWIVVEDIDLAPNEVLSVLIPLLEKRELFIPGRGEVIPAAPGFQIFATQTVSDAHGSNSRQTTTGLLSNYWTRVFVEPLSSEELHGVVLTGFPSLALLVPKMIETFDILQLLRDTKVNPQLAPPAIQAGFANAGAVPNLSLLRLGRFISTRDLMKWCRRVAGLVGATLTDSNAKHVASRIRELAFIEAVDCFAGAIQSDALRDFIVFVIAHCWELSSDRVIHLLRQEKPSVHAAPTTFNIGRASLPVNNPDQRANTSSSVFAYTRHTLELIERVAQSLRHDEPVLLVGETGAGKTSTIQHLARQNMNQQSDSADLLGGFKPVELRLVCEPLKQTFEKLFCKTFSKSKNRSFLERVQQAFASKDWRGLINLFKKAVQLAEQKISEVENANLPSDAGNASTSMITPTKRQKTSETTAKTTYESSTARPVAQTGSTKSKAAWVEFKVSVERFELQHEQLKNNFAFSFIEGALVKAVRKGHWVLLDEINLASQETLESLSGLLEGSSLTLSERGDIAPIKRHPSFRLIGCMNPANDVGKKDLPPALRNRFSEFVLRELTNKEDLQLFVVAYLQSVVQNPPAQEIVEFYLAARHEAETSLSDGANQRPHYSLRTLARALDFTRTHAGMFGFDRSLVEGFLMSFLTQLDARSYPIMKALIKKFLQRGLNEKILERAPRNPGPNFVQFEQFWLELGPLTAFEDPKYILTPTIRQHLINLSRTLTSRKIPILLQGPTSAGKTSMLEYLAKRTGHRFVRINNHEHTDLQEYLGQYISDSRGKLYFQEGILVEAVRKGYWIVLDELNLAPSEVLEALNRLLDDNRELFIPETQETVKPHPHFMLFATQNPPGLYGGRKALSRAFRNRFIELHFDEIPDDELETILRERCFLPQSYCHQLVLIMKELQRNRQGSQVFAGRHGFITLRDLFRWAERHPTDYQQLADHGYMLLADRLRDPQEQVLVKQVLEKFLRVTIDVESLYEREFLHMMQTQSLETSTSKFGHAHSAHNLVANNVVWTRAMKRLYALVANCLRYKEPILLVGETGTGKTTVCQVLAELLGQELHILNCHQHTETADFIGGLRPVRGKEATVAELKVLLTEFFALARAHTDALFGTGVTIPAVDLDNVPDALRLFDSMSSQLIQNTNIAIVGLVEYPLIMTLISSINKKIGHYRALFSWYDGPLVKSMREGDILLVDEISLAEDAVLERLNSVLEPSRVLTIAEKGGAEVEELTAHADFRILATMNPGGDFGKKELSPALRNRFTEVWVPAIENRDDLAQIIAERLAEPSLRPFARMMLDFIHFFAEKQYHGKNPFSLRDILSWVDFMRSTFGKLGPAGSYLHGAQMILLDGLGITHPLIAKTLQRECMQRLNQQVAAFDIPVAITQLLASAGQASELPEWINDDTSFGIGSFSVPKVQGAITSGRRNQYTFDAPTTATNLIRLLRSLQLKKPVLLEGSPGVGKTTLVEALGQVLGRRVVRINLSEQTDMLDLLGADLPQEDGPLSSEPTFTWRDGVFLDALKAGDWVLLDEMNLANQSVLEGLNAVLDHRATVYIPELNQSFICPPTFRIFACQNPTTQGGGRKGLPKSFLNRFTKVYLDKFETSDLLFVANSLYGDVSPDLIDKMVTFNQTLFRETMEEGLYGRLGSPWEFNLRDILRWCSLVRKTTLHPGHFVDLLYLQRMRTQTDRDAVCGLYKRIFQADVPLVTKPYFSVTPANIQVGHAAIPRRTASARLAVLSQTLLLQRFLNPLETLLRCVEMGWMGILVGPSASGKSSLVRLLADVTGNVLHTFSVNASVDTMELLGTFEQVDLNRHKKEILDDVSRVVYFVSRWLLLHDNHATQQARLDDSRALFAKWAYFRNSYTAATTSPQAPGTGQGTAFAAGHLQQLREIVQSVGIASEQHHIDLPEVGLPSAEELLRSIDHVQLQEQRSVTGSFEWVDGILVRALQRGEWIVMDNVNLCAGAVLDRLLPLLEPEGSLSINERGLINGEVPTIRPHPNFRIFFTMDPANGEISRAMRNRGVEICLGLQHTDSSDTRKLVEAAGQIGSALATKMMAFHATLVKKSQRSASQLASSIRDLLNWAGLALEQVQRGRVLPSSLQLAMEEVYVRSKRQASERHLIQSLFTEHFQGFSIEFKRESMLVSGVSWRPVDFDSTAARFDVDIRTLLELLRGAEEHTLSAPIKHAIELVAQRSTTSDARMRLMWLSATLAGIGAAGLVEQSIIDQLQDYAVSFFQRAHGHELALRMRQLQESLVSNNELFLVQTPDSLPLDLRINEPTFGISVRSERGAIIDTSSRIIGTLPDIISEDIATIQQQTPVEEKTLPTASFNSLQQSLAYFIGRIDENALSSSIAGPLWPFFKAMDDQLAQWAREWSSSGSPALVRSALALRSAMWKIASAHPSDLDIARLMVLARYFLKLAKSSGLAVTERFSVSDARLTEAHLLHFDSVLGSMKNLLYKQGDKHIVFSTLPLAQLSGSISGAASAFAWHHEAPDVPRTSPELWNLLVQGLATVYLLQAAPQSSTNSDVNELMETLSLIPEKAHALIVSNGPRDAKLSLVSAWDHMSLQLEHALLVQVLGQVQVIEAGLIAGTDVASLLREVDDAIQRFLDFGRNTRTTRSPIDWVPYKLLTWLCDPSQPCTMATIASAKAATLEALHMHEWRILHSAPSEPALLERIWSRKSITGQLDQDDSITDAFANSDYVDIGLSRFTSAPQSSVIMATLTQWENTPVSSRDDAVNEIEDVIATLSRAASTRLREVADDDLSSPASMKWQLPALLMQHTLRYFIPTLPEEYQEEASELIGSIALETRQHKFAARLLELLTLSSDVRLVNTVPVAVAPMMNCVEKLSMDTLDGATDLYHRGLLYAGVGLVRLLLSIPTDPIDPCLKHTVKTDYFKNAIDEIQHHIDVLRLAESQFTGRSTTKIIEDLLQHQEQLRRQLKQAEARVVVRPNSGSNTFGDLFRELQRLCTASGLASRDRLDMLVSSFATDASHLAKQNEAMWQNNMTQTITMLKRKFADYMDVIGTVATALMLMKRGVRLVRLAAEYSEPLSHASSLFSACAHLQSVINVLVSTPSACTAEKVLIDVESVILAPATFDALDTVASTASSGSALRVRANLLRVSLEKIRAVSSISGYLSTPVLRVLDRVFAVFVETHQRVKREDAERELREASLFKYKTKTIEIETSEQREERLFRESFPNYFKEFSELLGENQTDPNLLNTAELDISRLRVDDEDDQDGSTNSAQKQEESVLFSAGQSYRISDEDAYFLCRSHYLIFSTIQPYVSPSAGFVSDPSSSALFMESYKASAGILQLLGERTPLANMDSKLATAHVWFSHLVNQRLAPGSQVFDQATEKSLAPSSHPWQLSTPIPNFYAVSNPAEVSIMVGPVKAAQARIRELLAEEQIGANEVLLLLDKLLQRLLESPLFKPLMHFMTGLEVFLRKSQDWELYQPVRYSIKTNIDQIMSVVSRWRRLELEYWPYLLRAREENFVARASQWWFHLYGIIHFGASFDIMDFQKLIQEFMEHSTLGEFATRLHLVRSFYLQLQSEEMFEFYSPARSQVLPDVRKKMKLILFNLYRYFDQFSVAVEDEKANMRKPIEDKLKDFMKISRWDDASYYRLEKSAETSHRQLNKFTRDYEDRVLKLPFAAVMARQMGSLGGVPNEAFATPELTKEEFMSPAAVSDALTATSALKEHVKIHQRTSTLLGLESGEVVYSKLLGKMQRIICGDVFEAASRVSFVSSTADELASAIISRSQELRALTESNAGVQKRRAFRSLLKELDRQGVDYHSTAVKMDQSTLALLAEDNADPAARRLLHRQTLAMQSGATMGIDQAFTTLWHNADDYHYRVLSRLVTFRDLQAQYNRDLSSAEVRKLNGYIEHSLFMLLQQRRQLAESISQHEKLFALVHNGMSSTMDPSTDMALPHQAIRALLLSQKQAIDALCAQLEVLQQMLPACGGAARQLTPTVSSQLARLLQRKLASDSIINYLTDDNTENLLSRSTGLATGATVNAALANSAAIDDCVEFIKTTVVASVPHGFISSLARVASATAANLSAQMTRVRTQVQTSGEPPAKDISIAVDFKAKLDEVIRYIKLGVQHAKTNFASVSALVGREEARGAPEPETDAMDTDQPVEQPAPEEKPEEENDEDIQLLARSEHSLRTLLAQMHANAIASSLAELISVLDNSSLSASVHSACTLALRYHWPLLHQYLKLHSMVLRCMAMTHRSSYKLHYVLMNTFISLLRDGFCAPGKDGGEPAEGDVLTGVGGTGLGEGEGEKDISDQMDQLTEDQIMGQKDEEEHKPKDKNDEPVDRDTGVEMENDFDGEMKDVKSVEEDSEDEKDDNEKEPDREMGDVDPNKEDVVDEKLWNSDDEDEDEDDKKDSEKPEEKFEKDAPMPNNDKRDTEMSAKNDDTKDRNDKNQDQADDDNKDAPEQPEERPDPHGSESDSEPEEFPEINEDGDDKYEDNHHIKPHEEEKEFELPEDLNLDNHEDNGMEEGEDDSQDEGEGEENPNDIDKFPEQPDEPEGGDEGAEPPQEEQPGDEANEEGDQEIPQPEKGTHAVEDEDAMDEDKPDGDDEQEEPEIEANLQQQDQKMEDQPEAYGVQDNIGLPQQRIKNKDNQPNDDNKKQNEDEQEQDAANQDLQTADPSSGDAVASHQPDDTQSNTQQRERDPNPLRSLGDVLRHWRKKLEVVRDAADDAKDDTQEATQQQDQVDEEPTGDDNAAYEFVEQDQVADNQTMAAATEEQASKMDANMDHVAEEEEEQVSKDQEGEAEGEKDQMDVETKPPASEDRVLPKSGTAQMKEPTKDSTGDENTDEVMPDDAMDVEEENDDELEAARKRDVERASSGAKQEHSNAPDSEQDLDFKQLTPEDLVDMRQALEHEIAQWRNQPDQVALGAEIWRQLVAITGATAQQLCEQLRLILEPTLKAKLQGDYRTGKRINMRRVITYIASQFRKDKIWLRRTQPNKRNYQVLLALDDSQSVALGKASPLMRESVATICIALQRLQVGQLSLVKFGDTVQLLHPFSQPFTDDAASLVMPQLTFDQKKTNMEELMRTSIQMLELSRIEAQGAGDTMQLMFVIGDGRFGDKRHKLREWLIRAAAKNIFVVFLVIDGLDKESILDIQSISYPGGKLTMKPYIDDFPFAYYVILKRIESLPNILADSLRQWFEMIAR